jgi:hypothetical protein
MYQVLCRLTPFFPLGKFSVLIKPLAQQTVSIIQQANTAAAAAAPAAPAAAAAAADAGIYIINT